MTSVDMVTALLAEYGGRWQISPDDGVWIAVRRPTPTAMRVIAAHEAAELAEKLANAEATD
jgi:hypothetical protein